MKLLTLILLLTILFTGCSSGGNSSDSSTPPTQISGQFIDDKVQGLTYTCSSGATGITNANGYYTCNAGDNVTFKVGNMAIGTLAAQSQFFTPYSFYPTSLDGSLNLASLLQSLDSDGNSTNGIIVIDNTLASKLSPTADVTSPTFRTDTENDLGITLVSQSDAQQNLNKNIEDNGGTIPDSAHTPVANAGPDQNVHTTNTVVLNGSASSDIDGRALEYTWSFLSKPAGSNANLSDSTLVAPSFVADLDGEYVLSLVVNAGTILSVADTIKVTATTANSAPVADAGPAQNINTTATVTLDGSASSDADLDPLTYSWTLTSTPTGSNATLTNPTAVNPIFVADLDGSYVAQLIVNDGTVNSVPATVTITATTANSAPTITSNDNVSVYENQLNAITITALDIDGDSLYYTLAEIDFNEFNINNTTGVVTFKSTPDFETKKLYKFTATVTDSHYSVSYEVTLYIINLLEDNEYIVHDNISYGSVVSPYTSRRWIDRNVGAIQICTDLYDTNCYGDYYQWGRETDGHEKLDSNTTYTKIDNVDNNSSLFVQSSGDWLTDGLDDDGVLRSFNWSKIDGTSICPIGFRIPTIDEMVAETRSSNQIQNKIDAYNHFLKFPSAGYKYSPQAQLYNDYPSLLTNSISKDVFEGISVQIMVLDESRLGDSLQSHSFVANGFSVRCIENNIPINSTPPYFTSPSGAIVKENQTYVMQVTSEDPNNGFVLYSILGEDSNFFNINFATGVINFKQLADYETKTTYNIIVNVKSIFGNSNMDVQIILTDLYEEEDFVNHNGVSYGITTSPITNRVWLTENLPGWYQWGRETDGHEKQDSNTTDLKVTNLDNNNSNFVLASNSNVSWLADGLDDDGVLRSFNWSKIDGSSVCPVGFRVPTIAELVAETKDIDRKHPMNNFLQLRTYFKYPKTGSLSYDGNIYLWSSKKRTAILISGTYEARETYENTGLAIRCIQD